MTLTLSPAPVDLVGTLPRKMPVTVSMTAVASFSPRLLPSQKSSPLARDMSTGFSR